MLEVARLFRQSAQIWLTSTTSTHQQQLHLPIDGMAFGELCEVTAALELSRLHAMLARLTRGASFSLSARQPSALARNNGAVVVRAPRLG